MRFGAVSMQAPITHILPLASIRRERLLPAGGRIIARRGQQVNPADVVAEAVIRPEHLLLDISRGLGLSAKDADHYIQRRAGDDVGEGDVIAGPVGIGRRVVRAPRSGTVVVAGEGQVLMELEGEYAELKAAYSGVVTDILGDRGVVIEATGSLIQCVWGNGKINYGLLKNITRTREETITPGMLDVSLRGSVLVASICEDEKVLQTAEDLPVRGMILASMDSSIVPVAMNVSYPIVLIEGFGKLPMNQEAFKILTASEMHEAALNAEPWNRTGYTRPEVVIAVPGATLPETPNDLAAFATGQTVRVISPPYKGWVGTLSFIQQGLTLLPSGLRAQTADIRLANGDSVQVPLADLEIMG
jgi:hypothetical protein